MHGLSQRGVDFLQEELQLVQMLRLAFGKEAFVNRFEVRPRAIASPNATASTEPPPSEDAPSLHHARR